MPYKCSVKNCRSNFDSTTEKVTVFNFPKDQQMLSKWLNNVELKAKVITKSSRICIKHFSLDDIDNNYRSILKPNALPLPNTSEIDPAALFDQICEVVKERYSNLNVFRNANGMCIYQLQFTDDYSDVIFRAKIIAKKESMRLRIVTDNSEVLTVKLLSLAQVEELIEVHFKMPKNTHQHEEEFDCVVEEELIEEEPPYNAEEELTDFDPSTVEEEEEIYVETIEEENHAQAKAENDLDSGSDFADDEIIEYIDPLKCENCSITFKNELGLQHHARTCTHPKLIAFNCKVCGETFSSVLQLKIHQKKEHASINRIKCHLCSMVLINTASLNRHLNAVHLLMRPHKCSICGKSFASSSTRNAHEKTHEKNAEMEQFLSKSESGLYCCPNCSEKFIHSHQLRNHLEKNCYQPPRKRRIYKYPCRFCDKQFATKIKAAHHYLKEHSVKIENPQRFCFECNLEVDDYSNHIRIHTCQYSCSYCGLKFLTEETCNQHEVTKHPEPSTEVRPFPCLFCNAAFKSEYHLKSHVTSFHARVEKEFECEICKNRFSTRSLLNAHLRTHSRNAAMFTCRVCQKTFRKLLNLKNHSIAVHQTDEIYCCEIDECQERFKLLQELKIHQQLDHGVNLNIQKYFAERE